MKTWFTLFFIPLIPLGTKFFTVCTSCSATPVDREHVQQLVEAAQQQAAQPPQMTPDGPLTPYPAAQPLPGAPGPAGVPPPPASTPPPAATYAPPPPAAAYPSSTHHAGASPAAASPEAVRAPLPPFVRPTPPPDQPR